MAISSQMIVKEIRLKIKKLKPMHFKLKINLALFILCQIGCSAYLGANLEEDTQALKAITIVTQALSQKARQLGPNKSSKTMPKYLIQPFQRWDEKDYSIIQINVLDQFLTVNQLLTYQNTTPEEIYHLPTALTYPDEREKIVEIKEGKIREEVKFRLEKIKDAKLRLKQQVLNKYIQTDLNIGGGEESCGYHAIRNAILILNDLEFEPYSFELFNNVLEVNKNFGTFKINKILHPDDKTIAEGPWRRLIIQHRIDLVELSINNAKKATQKALKVMQDSLSALPTLLEKLKKSNDSESRRKIQEIWKSAIYQADKAKSEEHSAQEKSKQINTEQGNKTASETYANSKEVQKIFQKINLTIPQEIITEVEIEALKDTSDELLKEMKGKAEALSTLIQNFKDHKVEDTKFKEKIIEIWETLESQEKAIKSQAETAHTKAQTHNTEEGKNLALSASKFAKEAAGILKNAQDIINTQTNAQVELEEEEATYEDDYYDIEEPYDDEDYDEQSDGDQESDSEEASDEEDDESEAHGGQEPDKPNKTEYKSSLEQSMEQGDYLSEQDINYLYKELEKTMVLSKSTVIGTGELGLSQIGEDDSNLPIEEDTAKELFDRIIKKISTKSQHVVFVGEGNHWVTLVIKIIKNKLFYIIADSTNDQQYGLAEHQKGKFIAKAIKKIIDGTKEELLKLKV